MVLYLCSPKAGFITGQTFIIDGGMSKQLIYHNDEGWSLKDKIEVLRPLFNVL